MRSINKINYNNFSCLILALCLLMRMPYSILWLLFTHQISFSLHGLSSASKGKHSFVSLRLKSTNINLADVIFWVVHFLSLSLSLEMVLFQTSCFEQMKNMYAHDYLKFLFLLLNGILKLNHSTQQVRRLTGNDIISLYLMNEFK